jgi:hypothetical protein
MHFSSPETCLATLFPHSCQLLFHYLGLVLGGGSDRLDSKQQDIKLQRPHVERTYRYHTDTIKTNLNRIDRARWLYTVKKIMMTSGSNMKMADLKILQRSC